MNITLFGKRLFAGVTKLRLLRGGPPGLSVWALHLLTSVFIRERQRERLEILPRAKSHQEPPGTGGGGKEGFPPKAFGGA